MTSLPDSRLRRIERELTPKGIHGKTPEEIKAIRRDVQAMIKDPEAHRLTGILSERYPPGQMPDSKDPDVLALLVRLGECSNHTDTD